MNVPKALRVKPGQKIRLSTCDAGATPGCRDKAAAAKSLDEMLEEMRRLQYALYAEDRRALLVVLQGMDAAGKDGVVRHVMTGLNPQGCRVTSFKVPTALERQHDFLWRIHQAVPPAGEIGVFNRSHYEDVLVVRVHGLVPPEVWQARYEQINAFERHLAESGVTVVKLFLHISRKEQLRRLTARLDDPARNWKFTAADVAERRFWKEYQQAYGEMLKKCSTEESPWYVIPSDHKWYRNWAVARILFATLREMDPQPPPPPGNLKALRRKLLAGA